MRFFVGDVVMLLRTRTSKARGEKTRFMAGSIGCVCKVYASGFCCVQFEERCLRVHEGSLERTDEPGPDFNEDCSNGC